MDSLLFVPLGALAASVALAGLIAYLYRHRGKPGANWFMLTLATQALWCLTYGVGLLVPNPSLRLGLEAASVLALSWLGPLFLAFALDYTGRSDLVRSLPYGVLLLSPVATAGLLGTIPSHDLLWRDLAVGSAGSLVVMEYTFGPWAFALALLNSACVVVAVVVLVDAVLSYGPLYRKEAAAVAVSTVPVTLGLVLWFLRLGPYPYLNLAVVLSLPHAALDAYAFVGKEMFESNPTTQRAAEQAAFEDIPNPVLILDPEDRVVNFNAAAAELFGFKDADPLGAPVGWATGLDADLESASSVSVEGEGRVRVFTVGVEPLTDPIGERVGSTVVLSDVTREREREQRLEVLNRVLRHNLRNEMTVILGFADFIAERADDAEVREWAETIAESGRSLSDIGEKAREFDKLRKREPDLGPVDVDALVEGVRQDLDASFPGADVEYDVRTERSPHADAGFLRVALQNLLENAVEHGANSGDAADHDDTPVSLVITDDGDAVRIDVRDDGPGIPEAEYRPVMAGEESALNHGSGIGLWIVKWCVEAVGGELRFDGSDGTTVSVLLPVAA